MRAIFTSLFAVAIAVTANAQGNLIPAGGAFYPDDAMNQGAVTAVFEEAVATPTATITYGGTSYAASVEEVGFTGTTYRVDVAEVMNGQAANTAFQVSIAGLTGSYTWQPVFPLSSVSPASGTELTSKTLNVVFNFSPAISYTGVRLTSGSVTREISQSSTSATKVTVAVNESDWGMPVGGVNTMTVELLGVKAKGVSISNVSGTEGSIVATYTIAEASENVTFLGVNPAENEATAAELWDYWNVSFMFSDAVELTDENVTAVVKYYRRGGVELEDYTMNIPTEEIYADWNYRGGYYGIEVPAPELPSDLPSNFAYLTITLQGIAYNGALLNNQPSATYQKTITAPAQKIIKNNTAGIADSIITNNTHEVYNLHGVKVGEVSNNEISSLPSGIYLIGGRKVVVK